MTKQIECEEGSLNTSGGKVYYLRHGSRNTDRAPLIIIHGGPGFTHHYLESLYVLASERPVIFYDQLGCGQSDRPKEQTFYTVDYYVSELAQLIEHLNVEQVSLLGHSWGSVIAAEYASRNDRVSHLIFASPYLGSKLWMADADRYISKLPVDLKYARHTKVPEVFMELFNEYYKRHVYGNVQSERTMQKSAVAAGREVYQIMWGENEFNISGVLKDYDATEKLKNIKAKTLFTCGESDTGSPKACKELASNIPSSKIKVFKKCAHFPHLEQKLEYVECLRNFLNDKPLPGNRIVDKLKSIFS